jgi:diadenosine tetraphosphatase ApaH/serine/threonine PP2A family protein phosphatase
LVVCGHTHMQFDRRIGDKRVVNAGSVGLPFGSPGADWLMLGPDVQLRHTLYDFERAGERVRATGYPEAESLATRDIPQPKPEAEMIERFSKVEIQ